MELKKTIRHEIKIIPTANEAYIVKIGCAEFAFTDPEKLAAAIQDYLKDPKGHEEKYNRIMGSPTVNPGSRTYDAALARQIRALAASPGLGSLGSLMGGV